MHIAVKNFNSILEAVIASERWLSLHSCTAVPGKCRSHITHHLYSELKKTILWKLNACMDDLVLFEDLDETKIHTSFTSLAFSWSELTVWKVKWPKLRGAHSVLPTCWPLPMYHDSASQAGLLPYSQLQKVAAAPLPSVSHCCEGLTSSLGLGTGEELTRREKESAPTHSDDFSISKLTTSCSRPSTVDNHNIRHRMVY